MSFAYDPSQPEPVNLTQLPPGAELPERFEAPAEPGDGQPEGLVSPEDALEQVASASSSPTAALRSLARQPGSEVREALEARLETIDEIKDWEAKYYFKGDLHVALLATGQRQDWSDALERELRMTSYNAADVQGLATVRGNEIPFASNPWEISESASLSEALETVWQPLHRRLAGFLPVLHARCMAVALVTSKDGAPGLAYLYMHERDPYLRDKLSVTEPVPNSIADKEIHRWVGVADVSAVVGSAPNSALDTKLADGQSFTLPLALREFRSRHAWFGAGGGASNLDRTLNSLFEWCDRDVDWFREQNDGAHPRRFVSFGGDGMGNADVFDLGQLDSRQDPLVADWDHETREVSDRQPFWVRVDQKLRWMLGHEAW